MKILFLCKKRHAYGSYFPGNATYGLINSAKFVAAALNDLGIEAKVVNVDDGNGIDREVTIYNPTHVVLEALWVTPEKLEELVKLRRHRHRIWCIRLHSKIPFLAMEGIAFARLKAIHAIHEKHPNVFVSSNSIAMCEDIENTFHMACPYQPNIYYMKPRTWYSVWQECSESNAGAHIDVGCFGAVRPLKNTLTQAIAAIAFADDLGKKLKFHINGNRTEQQGEQVIKNLRALFPIRGHKLVEHDWTEHGDFIKLVKTMHIGMQVSFTETFDIVAADFVAHGVPIVVSSEIEWLPPMFYAKPSESASIRQKLNQVWWERGYGQSALAYYALIENNHQSAQTWVKWLQN